MKILIVSQYFYPENFRVNDLVRSLVEKGHQVTVLTGQPNYPSGRIFSGYGIFRKWRQDYFGAKVIRVPLIPRGKGRKLELVLNYLSFVFFALVLGIPQLLFGKFDVQFVFATSPITAAIPACVLRKFKGWPLAIWVQDLWPESVASVRAVKSSRIIGFIGSLVSWIYRNSDLLLVPSQGFRPSIRQWGGLDNQITYIPNWAEDDYLSIPQVKPLHKDFRMLFAGNLGHAQALEVLLAAAQLTRTNDKIQWHVMGDGSRRDWLLEQISAENLQNVIYHERRPVEDMPKVYQQFDALLVLLNEDPVMDVVLPSKVQSIMAAGKPVLASGGSEMQRVVREANCGVAVPAGKPERLAEAAIQLSQLTQEQCLSMGFRGREYFKENYRRDLIVPQIEQVFLKLKEKN